MNKPHFNDPVLQDNLKQFLSFQQDRQRHLDQLNDDIKTMENLFRSAGVGRVECIIEDDSKRVVVSDGLALEAVSWDPTAKRIMYAPAGVLPGVLVDEKPLIEQSFAIRQRAKDENWLLLIFELVIDEMRQERDDLGGPVWEKKEEESINQIMCRAFDTLESAHSLATAHFAGGEEKSSDLRELEEISASLCNLINMPETKLFKRHD